jgi:hypothetical protein
VKNVCYALVGNIFIAVWGRANLSDAEFPTVLEVFQGLDFQKIRMLVITEGGGPTPVQRKSMNVALNGKEMATAVVSDDLMVRGTVTALGWFNKKVRSFPMAALNESLEYLGVPDTKFEAIAREITNLRAELNRQKPDTAVSGSARRG